MTEGEAEAQILRQGDRRAAPPPPQHPGLQHSLWAWPCCSHAGEAGHREGWARVSGKLPCALLRPVSVEQACCKLSEMAGLSVSIFKLFSLK